MSEKSCISCFGKASYTSQALATHVSEFEKKWHFDCGTIDTMTYDKSVFVSHSVLGRKMIHTANGDSALVHGDGTISLSPMIIL